VTARVVATLKRLAHAWHHPSHTTAVAHEDDAVVLIWCQTCREVFFDRIHPPRTAAGVMEKAARSGALAQAGRAQSRRRRRRR